MTIMFVPELTIVHRQMRLYNMKRNDYVPWNVALHDNENVITCGGILLTRPIEIEAR